MSLTLAVQSAPESEDKDQQSTAQIRTADCSPASQTNLHDLAEISRHIQFASTTTVQHLDWIEGRMSVAGRALKVRNYV